MRLVYLSPVPWTGFAQRPHKFAEWFHARCGGEVLWIDPYPTRLPTLADFQKVRSGFVFTGKAALERDVPHWVTVIRMRTLPIEPLPGAGLLNRLLWSHLLRRIDRFVQWGECLLAIGKPSELALCLLDRYPAIRSLYDAMDDFSGFYRGLSRRSIMRRERKVAGLASRISVSSTRLAVKFASCGSKVSPSLNACDPASLPAPKVKTAGEVRPVVGYVGTIGRWFDWPLVFALAEANPSVCIRLIGPASALPSGRPPRNLELLPACGHSAAIRAMEDFSIGIIPFKHTELTHSVDPIKYYEYRALGLPVISSRFGEMALREGQPGLFFFNGHDGLGALVRTALDYRCNVSDVETFRSANSWEARFDALAILP
jgi:hypothetical protein